MNMDVTKGNIFTIIFNVLCALGCTYQIINIATSYFSYETVTKNRYSAPYVVSYPELHFCIIHLIDAVDWDAIEKKYSKSLPHKSSLEKLFSSEVLTINDLIQFSPDFEMVQCTY